MPIDRERSIRREETRDALVHDLRTPLNAILAWAQLLSPDADKVQLQRGLDAIVRSARRQARLLDGLGAEPVAPPEDTTAAITAVDTRLSGLRILIVDDEEATSEATARILTAAGASVDAVTSGAAALRCLHRHSVDVLVSDITMPSMDGYHLLAAVRTDTSERVRMTPAIALTALTSSLARQRGYLAGFQLHLTKPVDRAELCLAIASVASWNMLSRPAHRLR